MKPLISLLLFVLLVQGAFAQKAVIKEISEIAPVSKEKYVFPNVIISGNKRAENKINNTLREEVLYLDSGKYTKSIFEEVWQPVGESDGRWIFTDFSYKIYSNTNRVLCLSVSFVGGKHSQEQTQTFLFDTFTGEQVKLEKLLNDEGKKWLEKTITAGRDSKLRKEIAIAKDSIQKHRNIRDAELKEDDQKTLQIFTACLEREDDLEYCVFYLQNNHLFIDGPACDDSWNALRLGGGLNYAFSRPVKEIQPYLSTYGKQLLQEPLRLNK